MWRKLRRILFSWLVMKPDCTYKRPPAMFGLQLGKRQLCELIQDELKQIFMEL
jgi:hypothetical protein